MSPAKKARARAKRAAAKPRRTKTAKPAKKRPARSKGAASRRAATGAQRAKTAKTAKKKATRTASSAAKRAQRPARKAAAARPVVAKRSVHGTHSTANGLAPARRSGSTSSIALVPHAPAARKRHAAVATSGASAKPESGASDRWTKQRLLFDLARARATVHAAIRGISADDAERPTGHGKWSVLEIVLHLATRDQVRIDEMESALLGRPVSWTRADDEEMARINDEKLAAIRHLGWDEAVHLLDETRRSLLEQADSVPEESEAWHEDHAFGAMMRRLPPHDVHHAEAIRNWRESQKI